MAETGQPKQEQRREKLVVPIPRDLGLTPSDLKELKYQFENHMSQRLGAAEGVAARPVIVVVVVVFVEY